MEKTYADCVRGGQNKVTRTNNTSCSNCSELTNKQISHDALGEDEHNKITSRTRNKNVIKGKTSISTESRRSSRNNSRSNELHQARLRAAGRSVTLSAASMAASTAIRTGMNVASVAAGTGFTVASQTAAWGSQEATRLIAGDTAATVVGITARSTAGAASAAFSTAVGIGGMAIGAAANLAARGAVYAGSHVYNNYISKTHDETNESKTISDEKNDSIEEKFEYISDTSMEDGYVVISRRDCKTEL